MRPVSEARTGAEANVTTPLVFIESAAVVEVAKVVGEEVARYKFPPAFLKVQWLLEVEPSERASCGADEEAIWRSHWGVVVPIPTYPFP